MVSTTTRAGYGDRTHFVASMRSSKRPVGHLACAIRPSAVPDQVCRVPTEGFSGHFTCTEPMFAESGGGGIANRNEYQPVVYTQFT